MWTRTARLGVSGFHQYSSVHHQHRHCRHISGALLRNITRTNTTSTSRSNCASGSGPSRPMRQGRLRQPVFTSSTTNCSTRSVPSTRTFSSRTAGQQAKTSEVLESALTFTGSSLRSAASAVAVFAAVTAMTSGSPTQVAFASKRARQDRKERVSGSLRPVLGRTNYLC